MPNARFEFAAMEFLGVLSSIGDGPLRFFTTSSRESILKRCIPDTFYANLLGKKGQAIVFYVL